MSLPPHLDGLGAVRRAAVADGQGSVLDATDDAGWRVELDTGAAAVALAELRSAGAALGLTGLDVVLAKAGSRTTVTAARPDALLFAEVVPGQRTAEVEKALAGWAAQEAPAPRAAAPAASASGVGGPLPGRTTTSTAAVVAPEAASSSWAALRLALARGHLNGAGALLRALAEAPTDPAARPEAAVPDAAAFREASQRLLEGVGSVLAGDTAGGARALRDLAAPAQPNLSLRWLATHWCARAALVGGSVEVARRHVKDALDLSRQLDVEARAVSQLVAAELLLRAGEQDKALAWLAESRSRFERSADTWGQARAWLVEARLRAEGGDEAACLAAAERSAALEPGWDGPPIFLAGRALAAGDLAGAERLLAAFDSAAARRVRKLVASVRQGDVSLADGAEFLRLHTAPPTTTALRSLERIADAAPRFLPAREALGWMLVKLGRYGSARGLFDWLVDQELDAEDRALVTMGQRVIDAALQAGAAGGAPAPSAGAAGLPASPPGGEGGTPPRGLALGGADSGAVFSGRLSVFSLPDLIEFLRSARRSGLLVCSSPAGMGTMRFSQGYVTGGTAPGTPGVVELLARAGRLSAEARQAVEAAPEAADGIEVALARDGLVEPAALEEAVRRQVELTVRQLYAWSDGEFAFKKDPAGAEAGQPEVARVDAQALLLNLFKELDEASREPSGAGDP